MSGTQTERLTGWKTIGAFVGRDARTARRWEAERGLPVHRVPGGGNASVWADPEELRNWMKGAPPELQAARSPDPPAQRFGKRGWLIAACALGIGATSVPIATRWAANASDPPGNNLPYGNDAAANETWRLASLSRDRRSVPGLLKAEAMFDQLSKTYPKNAAAFIGLAETDLLLREFNSLPSETAYRRATLAAEHALALDPASPAAMRALAFCKYWNEGNRAQAMTLFERAIRINPDDALSWHWYGTALLGASRASDALSALDKASQLNPDSSAIAADRGYAHYLTGDHKGAVAGLREVTQIDPEFSGAHYYLERIYLIEGNGPAYLAEAGTTARLKQQSARLKTVAEAAAAYKTGGKAAMLSSLIADETRKFDQDGESAIRLAMLNSAAGNRAEVLRWLTKAEAIREPGIGALDGYIEFVPYRDSSDFKRFFPAH